MTCLRGAVRWSLATWRASAFPLVDRDDCAAYGTLPCPQHVLLPRKRACIWNPDSTEPHGSSQRAHLLKKASQEPWPEPPQPASPVLGDPSRPAPRQRARCPATSLFPARPSSVLHGFGS